MVKIIRFLDGFAVFDVDVVKRTIKVIIQKRISTQILDDPEIGEDIDQDHNGIVALLYINYALKTFKLVLVIFNLTFFSWNVLAHFLQCYTSITLGKR